MSDAKNTLLTAWHEDHGATLSEFGGYRMPLWYKTGPIREHRAVIEQAGLFDTSHMAEILIEGPDAFALLQSVFTRDLQHAHGKNKPLAIGRSSYGFVLNEKGHLIDDAIVMREAKETMLLVVNAGMGAIITRHLLDAGAGMEVAVSDLTGKLSKIDLQGPASADILAACLSPTASLNAPFPYFSFTGHYDHLQGGVQTREGHPVLVSRTGYTGEFGFELFVRPDGFLPLWEALLTAGTPRGLIPCGLGARDSLRAGAGLPLSHQDLGDWPARNHPWDFALPWKDDTSFTKNFIGAEALLKASNADSTYLFLGESGRKVEPGADVIVDGDPVGTVLTCATDMAIDQVDGQVVSLASPGAPENFSPKGLSCGFIKSTRPLDSDTVILLKDKRREIPVRIVKSVRPDRSARMPWPLD